MELTRDLLLILHFIGLASLLGGFLVQMKPAVKVINPAMFHGVLTQLVTGLALVGLAEARDVDVDHTKVGIKLAITLAIAIVVFVCRKRESVTIPVWGVIGALTVINIAVAVLWR
ncbi:MAG: hypothetical protein CVT64_08760 [Actinobacteria bacterium HGW-Actinobacteria-4]|nr:MAG: hypothetical protein CVT64_08760 [Actinobacteria bacterium HGW-Actinobacteria-4]